jgi:hypothetical protein
MAGSSWPESSQNPAHSTGLAVRVRNASGGKVQTGIGNAREKKEKETERERETSMSNKRETIGKSSAAGVVPHSTGLARKLWSDKQLASE